MPANQPNFTPGQFRWLRIMSVVGGLIFVAAGVVVIAATKTKVDGLILLVLGAAVLLAWVVITPMQRKREAAHGQDWGNQ